MSQYNRHRDRNVTRGIYQSWYRSTFFTTSFAETSVTPHKIEEMWDIEDPNFRDKLHAWIRHRVPLPVRPMRKLEVDLSEIEPVSVFWKAWNTSARRWEFYDGRCLVFGPGIGSGSAVPVLNSNMTIKNRPNAGDLPSFSSSEKDALLQKALAKARTSSWDVGTFTAELHKTARMIRNVGRGVIRRQEKVLSSGVKSYDEFLSAWLEYRYGWRILYYDIMEANESLLRLKGLLPLSNRYTAYAEKEYTAWSLTGPGRIPGFRVQGNNISPQYHRWNLRDTTSTGTSLRAGVFLELDPGQLAFADPLNTAIEILPYALVANWFINIKDLVAAWSPFATGRVVHGFTTENIYTRSFQEYVNPTILSAGSTMTDVQASYDLPAFKVDWSERIREERTPVMNLRLRLNMDWANLVDFIAIFATKYNSIRNLRGR